MVGIVGELRIIRSAQMDGVNAPGVVRLADDEFTAMWMDPDGAVADGFDQDPKTARKMFLAEKLKARTERSNRRK